MKIEKTKSRKKFKPSHIYSIISTSLVLFVVGVMSLIFIDGHKLTQQFKENLKFSVILNDNAKQTEIDALKSELENKSYIKWIEFVSKEEAAKRFKDDTGEDFSEILDGNPLYNSIDLQLKSEYTVQDSIDVIESEIKSNPIVSEFYYEKQLVDLINNNVQKVGMIIIGVSILLLLVAITLIDSTVRLSMYSSRFLIRSMQLVGATRGFIVKPFLMRGLIDGLISGVAAVVLLLFTLRAAIKLIPDLTVLQDKTVTAALFVIIILIGVIFSLISTRLAVYKYLKMKLEDLY